jgi:rod shape determining protein RodA
VFVGFAFAMLFWAGVSWPLLVLAASPVVSLIFAFNPMLWGAWFFLLIALVLWYKPYMYEGIFLVVMNVIFGVVSPIVWDKLAPYQQKRLAFLPEQYTDFIFAVVGEELGFIGVTFAIALFLFLFLRVTKIAERANDSFSSLVAFGLLASWLVHVLVNVGMTLNLMPITGIPLPFFSYGGSFMLASWLAIGILVRISAEGRGGRNGPFAV